MSSRNKKVRTTRQQAPYQTQDCQFDFVFSSDPRPATYFLGRLQAMSCGPRFKKTVIRFFQLLEGRIVPAQESHDGQYHVIGRFHYTARHANRQDCCQKLFEAQCRSKAFTKRSILNYTKPLSCTVTEIPCTILADMETWYTQQPRTKKYRRDKVEFQDFIKKFRITVATDVTVTHE